MHFRCSKVGVFLAWSGHGPYKPLSGRGRSFSSVKLSLTPLGGYPSGVRRVGSSDAKYIVYNPESLALEHINSGNPTTWSVINKILSNQNIEVTESKLDQLLKVPGVELDLPISTPESQKLLIELSGKSSYQGFFGVYVFIHKETGHKYVGSSNLLRRRLDYYFKGGFPLAGKFLPLLRREGLKAFKLIIFKLDNNIYTSQDALLLEQYFLLSNEFNLNSLRVVNAGPSKGHGIYIYDLTCSTLYYKAKSSIELKRVLSIHPETCKKFVDSKLPYLNKFFLLSYPIPTASLSNISVQELLNIMQKERKEGYILGTRRSIPVELEIKKGNTFVNNIVDGCTLKFDSLTSCVEHLRVLGLTIKRDTLSRYIKMGKVFHNFLCKYSDKALPDNFEQVGLIVDEYSSCATKLKRSSVSALNKKNKAILVKKDNFAKRFDSITDTIKYFNTLNIKLDRKSLNVHLKDGNNYKGYIFAYK